MEDDDLGNIAMYDEDMEHDFYANRMNGDRNVDGDDAIEGADGYMSGGGLHTPWQDRQARYDGISAHHAVAAQVSRDNLEVTFDARADATVDIAGFELDPVLGIEISDEFLEDLRLLTTDDPDGATMLDADESVDLLESYLRRAEEQHILSAAADGGGRVEAARSRRTDQSSSHLWDAQRDEENDAYDHGNGDDGLMVLSVATAAMLPSQRGGMVHEVAAPVAATACTMVPLQITEDDFNAYYGRSHTDRRYG